ncbi:MAG: PDZ domain-containing protein [Actinobacteria bacterium]|nr:PDZ domain-containing protein [Actinomycetota bacterium]
MKRSIVKVLAGFVIGAITVGGYAMATTTSVPVVKACVDNKTNALFASSNGSCTKGRTAIDIGATGANVKSIAQLVSPSVVSLDVSGISGSGTGSGSIYKSTSTTTYIVTNNHVVEGAANGGSIDVELNNGDVVPGTIIGRDSEYDLAVVSIKQGNLPEIPKGDSTSIAIGDPVVAFGSPLGLSGTVTSGIVSALNRPVTTGSTSITSYIDAIQTDAAINPGNSGGPLVDSQGRIIGVNSAIASLGSSTSGNIGLGFSIPYNQAKRIIEEIISTGKSTKPIFGVSFDSTYTGVGAKIGLITAGKGADKAGIPVNSIIKTIDGYKISDAVSAIVRIRAHAPGDQVTVVVDLPSGGSKTFTVTLDSAPSL